MLPLKLIVWIIIKRDASETKVILIISFLQSSLSPVGLAFTLIPGLTLQPMPPSSSKVPVCVAQHLMCILGPVAYVWCSASLWEALKLDLDVNFSSTLCFLSSLLTARCCELGAGWLPNLSYQPISGILLEVFYFVPLNQSKKSVPFREKPCKTGHT